MFEETEPKTLKKWLILGAAVYFLMPFDLVPDVLGIPGRVDDFVAIGLFTWLYRNHLRRYVPPGFRSDDTGREGDAKGAASTPDESFDAHEVLQVPRSASGDAIRAAYRARMQEYHPDKVAHLGEALQKVAHEKSQEIQRAYQLLRD